MQAIAFLLAIGPKPHGPNCCWFGGQHPDRKTFKTFRQNAIDRTTVGAHHRALRPYLPNSPAKYIAGYEGEPIPVHVAEQSYRCLLAIVADAEGAPAVPALAMIDAVNRFVAAKRV